MIHQKPIKILSLQPVQKYDKRQIKDAIKDQWPENNQFHPMIPSATVKGYWVEPVNTEILRPIMPVSPTARSNFCGSCVVESTSALKEKECKGSNGLVCCGEVNDVERFPSRLLKVSIRYPLNEEFALLDHNSYPAAIL